MRQYVIFASRLVLSFAVYLLLLAPAVYAQRSLGSIQGDVSDSTGAKVPDATVTVEESSTHFKLITKSNGVGSYTFPQLNPGTYSVSITAASFKSSPRQASS